MLLLTIVVITVLLIISYLIFDKDIMAPPTVVALVLLFGSLCCYYNEKRWGINFSIKTTGLISTAIIATMIGGLIGVCLSNYKKGCKFSFSHVKTAPQEIYVSKLKTFVVIVFQIITIIMLLSYILRVANGPTWAAIITLYRQISTDVETAENPSLRMPWLTRNMSELSFLLSIVYSYIVGNNLVACRKKLSLNWVPVILYSITTFMQGDRSMMIRLWLTVLIVAYTVQKRSVGWRSSRETRKVIRLMVISVLLVGALFSVVREFVGRTSEEDKSMDPLYYVTFYAGSPTAVLDNMWRFPINKPAIFGARTFYYINQTLTILTGKPGQYDFYYPFETSPTGVGIGNAHTALRDPYTELGFWGYFFLLLAFGILYGVLYCKCRKRSGKSPIELRLLLYTYIAYTFFMYFYSCFNNFLSHVLIKYIIEWMIIRWALVGWQFKNRIRFTLGLNRRKSHQIVKM